MVEISVQNICYFEGMKYLIDKCLQSLHQPSEGSVSSIHFVDGKREAQRSFRAST